MSAIINLRPVFAFSAHKNGTDQSGISSGVATKVTFGTELYDKGSYFASSTWTPPAGIVSIVAALYYSGGVVDQQAYFCYVYKNAAAYKNVFTQASGTDAMANIAIQDEANGADTYEIYALGNGAGDKTVSGNSAYTFFMGAWLGPSG